MQINEVSYKWAGALTKRTSTKYIILHHRGGDGDVQSIHRAHVSVNGWVGIGYHFYVRKDGSVYRGRPINTVGAHCKARDCNNISVGICFEGNYQTEQTMPEAQKRAGKELVSYLKGIYPNAEVKGHRDFMATACPGRYFPFDDLKIRTSIQLELKTINDIVWELNHREIMTDKKLWSVKCLVNTNAYWLAYKIANLTTNLQKERADKIYSVNDIVWELKHRGIITNTQYWLLELDRDKDLYWLAYKAANRTINN